MNKPLYLFVGKSASGKTTIAEILEAQYGLKTLQSYTTRPKRHEDETGHTFITDEEFDQLNNIIAYTEYAGCKYCCTQEQLDNADIYVVDVPGVETLLNNYATSRTISIIYFDTSVRTRISRMFDRHDPDIAIVSRLYNDEEFNWEDKLIDLVQGHSDKYVELYSIDANQDIDSVITPIINLIYEQSEGSCNDYYV